MHDENALIAPERKRDLENRIEQYRKRYRQRVEGQPVKHRLRNALYRLHRLYDQLSCYPSHSSSDVRLAARLSDPVLRPPRHEYVGFRGPWMEERFFQAHCRRRHASEAVYVPIFWTNFYLYAQTGAIGPKEYREIELAIEEVLAIIRRSDGVFYTLIEYDHTPWDWHLFPENLIVFSSGGGGDVPIPLLMHDRPFDPGEKTLLCSFMGSLDGASDYRGIRRDMKEVFGDVAYFGRGKDWQEVMRRSHFALCPRGLGPTSFRLYEALSCGAIPIVIWQDKLWLPYREKLDWEEFGIVAERANMRDALERMMGIDEAGLNAMHARIARIYNDYFTYDAAISYVFSWVEEHDRSQILAITGERS